MGRLTQLTCDACGSTMTMPECGDTPETWVEAVWTEPGDDSPSTSAEFCSWRCAAIFCARMAAHYGSMLDAKGLPS